MAKKRAVCLLSGGLDSCVTAYIAQQQGYTCYALTFMYGQMHTKEIECAKHIALHLNVTEHLVFALDLKRFGGSALVDPEQIIPQKNYDDIGTSIPSTYVPARNTIFLSIAIAWAETLHADSIFIGANAVDYSGYPDCRPEYFKAFKHLVKYATKQAVEGKAIDIKTPLLALSKSDIIKKGVALNAPLHLTWSCYKGESMACGTCDSCQLRLKGFTKAGVNDPLPYADYPHWYRQH